MAGQVNTMQQRNFVQSSCVGWQKETACSRTGSNRRPLAHKTSALTTELQEPLGIPGHI